MSLEDYGWGGTFGKDLPGEPGRVMTAAGGWFRLITATGERRATLAGRLRQTGEQAVAATGSRLASPVPAITGPPVVGDWVIFQAPRDGDARIEAVMPRRTKLSRKVPGRRAREQVVAANVDLAFAMMGMDGDFSPRRLERLITVIRMGGARPVVLLNKSDLCGRTEELCRQARRAAPGVDVVMLSCRQDEGIDAVRSLLAPRQTAVLIGSSGVGKSTLINRLLGADLQATNVVRESDQTGQHTTTQRELFLLPCGALLIDNPGIREVQLWADEESLDMAFEDIDTLRAACRFRDCGHSNEPGCAVRGAIVAGELDPERLRSYNALHAELRSLAARRDGSARLEQKRRWRIIHKAMRKFPKR